MLKKILSGLLAAAITLPMLMQAASPAIVMAAEPQENITVQDALDNLALNKPATDSQNSSAGNAVDGNNKTSAGGNSGSFPYIWNVDLEQAMKADRVEIEWQDIKDGGTNIAEDWKFEIESSTDKNTWKSLIKYDNDNPNPNTDPNTSVIQGINFPEKNLARYYRVTITGPPVNRPLAWPVIAEFRVLGKIPEPNVALGKTAYYNDDKTTSNYANPSLALDGKVETSANQGVENNMKWNVNFQQDYRISRIELEWNTIISNSAPAPAVWCYKVQYSMNGKTWETVVDYWGETEENKNPCGEDPAESLLQGVDIPDGITARFMRVIIKDKIPGAWPVIGEFRAFGVPVNDSTNVALNKKASLNKAGTASNAVDGNPGTFMGGVKPSASEPYVLDVDLQGIALLDSVELELENIIDGSWIAADWKYKVEYSLNKTDWTMLADYTEESPYSAAENLDDSYLQRIKFTEPARARYLRVSLTSRPSNRPLMGNTIAEFRAFGKMENPMEGNIARGKPVVSVPFNENAEAITDGTAQTTVALNVGESLRLDLGLQYGLTEAGAIFSEGTALVEGSADGQNWTELWTAKEENRYDNIALDSSLRYVRITAGEGGFKMQQFWAQGTQTASANPKRIMVVVPHPDDEVIEAGGVIHRAVQNGDYVSVVLATLGDYGGKNTGKIRMKESINALGLLGVEPENIHFFGYSDNGGLAQYGQAFDGSLIYKMYLADNPDELFYSAAKDNGEYWSSTYNGNDKPSYRYATLGEQAEFTRNNFIQDLETVIMTNQPDEIYATSRFDLHADHAFLTFFISEAIINHQKNVDENYNPVVYEGIVHSTEGDSKWPERNSEKIGIKPINKPIDFEKRTMFDWNQRISITVPEEMQKVPFADNLKSKALLEYKTQMPSDYISSFAKLDEVFWAQPFDSVSYLATATASSEKASTIKAQDQSAAKAIDGIRDGYSTSLTGNGSVAKHNRFPFAEWVSNAEKENAWLKLEWENSYNISSVTLFDRPNLSDHITKASLVFSNGTSIPVGPLPNDGRPLNIELEEPVKANWVKLEVVEVSESTTSVGLAEMEVRGEKIASVKTDLETECQSILEDITNQTLLQKHYTAESWQALTSKLAAAQTVIDNPNASQKLIDDTLKNLKDAKANLVERPIDKTILENAVETIEQAIENGVLKAEDYTAQSWKVLQDAIAEAKEYLADTNIKQWQLEESAEKVQKAAASLVIPAIADKASLIELYAEVSGYLAAEYENDGWENFAKARSEALAVILENNAGQEKVDTAFNALKTAKEALKPVSALDANKTMITKVYEAAKLETNYKQENYTTESWAAFAAELEKSKAAIDKTNATQSEVDAQSKNMLEAVKNLQTKPEVTLPANKNLLSAVTESFSGYNENDYEAESWNAYTQELTKAKAKLEEAEATQGDLDTALNSLASAMYALVPKTAEKTPDNTALKTFVESCAGKTSTEYTQSSWAIFETALDEANALLLNSNATQMQLDTALEKLALAANNLVPAAPAIKTSLQNLYDVWAAKNNEDGRYTEQSWQTLKDALAQTDELLKKENATVIEYSKTLTVLKLAADSLVKSIADKTVLKALYDKWAAENNDKSVYTAESWQVLQNALKETKLCLDDAEVLQKDVTAMQAKLEKAVTGLVKSPSKPTPPPSSSDTSKPDKPAEKEIKVSSLTLNMMAKDLKVGKSVTLKAKLEPSNATDKKIVWKSSNTKVATVSQTGKVKAIKAGKATITATAGGKKAVVKIRVNNKLVPVKKLTLSKKSVKLSPKKSVALKATVLPKNASNKKVVWKSSNPKIAKVSSSGKVTALKKGKVTIYATSQESGKIAKCTITVTPK